VCRAHDPAMIDTLVECRRQPSPGLVAPDDAREAGAAAQPRHVIRRLSAGSRNDLSGVVLENQYWRLARDTRHAAVDELVRDDVADDGDCSLLQPVYEREELRRIHPTASIKFFRIASACTPSGASWLSAPDRPSTARVPAARPQATSSQRSPTITDLEGSSSISRHACSIMPCAGLRQPPCCR